MYRHENARPALAFEPATLGRRFLVQSPARYYFAELASSSSRLLDQNDVAAETGKIDCRLDLLHQAVIGTRGHARLGPLLHRDNSLPRGLGEGLDIVPVIMGTECNG